MELYRNCIVIQDKNVAKIEQNLEPYKLEFFISFVKMVLSNTFLASISRISQRFLC